jgi:chromosome segregation ATPase
LTFMGRDGIIEIKKTGGRCPGPARLSGCKSNGKGEIVELVKFDELEKKINDLVGEYQLLKKRNLELEALLQTKNVEMNEANNKMGVLKEERDAVRTKVDSLLDLLQEIKSP